jgi:N-acetylglucosaminyldiphosphoundecaprenol N-acetyl-beta-D-mannosaminyltransferase
MYHAVRDSRHRTYILHANLSLCDGIGVVIAGRVHGIHIPRFNGPVLMEQCCAYGLYRGWRHYFYGGKPGVVPALIDRFRARFPAIKIAGWYSPPFRAAGELESATVLEDIQRSEPDIVWVGLGLLKQERWITDHIGRLLAPWFVGVGAAFDFHAGTACWAPSWVQRAGFEWLYRLLHEPRMLIRNVRSFVFMGQAIVQGTACRIGAQKVL